MLPQFDSANLLDHLIDLLAVRIAELLADRLKPPNGVDLSRTVDRIERLLQSRGAAQSTAVASGGEADRKWGFPFAIDGVVGTEEARVLLGGCSERTLNRHVIAGKIRRGKDGKRAVYCHRSVMRYLAGLEE